MKSARNIFNKWFFCWLIPAILIVIIMCIFPTICKPASAVIMAGFMLLPVRDWIYRFVIWALDYVSSNNTSFRDMINRFVTMNTLLDPKTRVENVGFHRTLRVAICTICTIMALLWLIFQSAAFNVVFSFLHTMEFIVRGKIGATALLFYILLSLAYVFFLFKSIGWILKAIWYMPNGKFNIKAAWWRITIIVVCFYGKIIISGLLLKLHSEMIASNVLFWSTVVGFPIAILEIWRLIRWIRNKRRSSS